MRNVGKVPENLSSRSGVNLADRWTHRQTDAHCAEEMDKNVILPSFFFSNSAEPASIRCWLLCETFRGRGLYVTRRAVCHAGQLPGRCILVKCGSMLKSNNSFAIKAMDILKYKPKQDNTVQNNERCGGISNNEWFVGDQLQGNKPSKTRVQNVNYRSMKYFFLCK